MDSMTGKALDLYQWMTLALAEHLILSGVIDPSGRDETEVMREALEYWTANQASILQVPVAVRFEDDLLREARRYVEEGQRELALVLYATCIEHLLNDLIVVWHRGQGKGHAESVDLIRRSKLGDKVGPKWQEWFGFSMDEKFKQDVLDIARARNEVVHYKWYPLEMLTAPPGGVISVPKTRDTLGLLLERCEPVVDWLGDFRCAYFFHGFDRRKIPRTRGTAS